MYSDALVKKIKEYLIEERDNCLDHKQLLEDKYSLVNDKYNIELYGEDIGCANLCATLIKMINDNPPSIAEALKIKELRDSGKAHEEMCKEYCGWNPWDKVKKEGEDDEE